MNYPNMVKIEEINNQNPWWKYGVNYGQYDADLTRLQNQKVKVRRNRVAVEKIISALLEDVGKLVKRHT